MHATPVPAETHFEMSDLDRRTWPRFERRIRVLLLPEDSALEEPYGGWIVNGSRGGVCLMVRSSGIEAGTVLHLRQPKSARHSPWVAVRVKYRAPKDDGWELGCEFLRPAIHETAVLFN